MTSVPYQFIKRGNLFIVPVGPSIDEVQYPTQSFSRPRDYSTWVNGKIEDPSNYQIDRPQTSPSVYQDVRDDLVRFSPVEVTRSAFQRSQHTYVGVIDSRGTPYYFALDGRGISVREADPNDDRVWKTFYRLLDGERGTALHRRRSEADDEMLQVNRELSEPKLVITKALRYGKIDEVEWHDRVPGSTWWRVGSGKRPKKQRFGRKRTSAPKVSKESVSKAVPSSGPIAQVTRAGRQYSVTTHDGKVTPLEHYSHSGRVLEDHLPHGFRVGSSVSPHLASVHAGVPKGELDPNAIHVVKPSEVAARNPFGDDLNQEHLASIKQAWGEGKRLDPIEVRVTPSGQWHVEDGNHRLHVAAGTDSPVAVRFRNAGEDVKKFNAKPIGDRLRSARVDHAAVEKALPRGGKEEKVKKTPTSKASKKQAGAGGKTRYTYPNEKRGSAGQQDNQQVPLVVAQHDDAKNADPGELANQLGVSVRTLQRTAKQLDREEFAKFMRSHLKMFAAKHRLDPDYWTTLHDKLSQMGDAIAKSDGGLKEFSDHVKMVASAVAPEHSQRFGDRKVFIHHVHDEMANRGLYSGGLDKFKQQVVQANRAGHLRASRADYVAALDPTSVGRSETEAGGATFHFVEAPHDPGAADKLSTLHPQPSGKPRTSRSKSPELAAAAKIASQKAKEASVSAERLGSREAHMAAMEAHHQAGAAHQKATGRISSKTALSHFDQSRAHLHAAVRVSGKATE